MAWDDFMPWNWGREVSALGRAQPSPSQTGKKAVAPPQKSSVAAAAAAASAAYNARQGMLPTTPPGSNPANKKPAPARPAPKAAADPYAAAQAKAAADAKAAQQRAGQSYLDRAANLDAQAAALKYALETGFNAALQQNLGDVGKSLDEQLGVLKEGAAARARGFLDLAADTEKAAGTEAEDAFANLVRERQDTMAGILEQGAGETDTLRAMVMAARNWQANQTESNRAYFDTMRSTNNAITDLNLDTQTGLANAHKSAETERERLWQDFYNRRSDTFTQLGNVYGQQRDYYAQAKEMEVKPPEGKEDLAKTGSETAFMDAAKEAGKSYEQQGLPDWIRNYKGQEQLQARQSNTDLAAAMRFAPIQQAEGATLRAW